MSDVPAPPKPVGLPAPRDGRGRVTSGRVLLGTGGVMMAGAAAIDWSAGALVGLGRIGLDLVALQGPIFAVGAATLVLGAVLGRRASRRARRSGPDA